VSPTAPKVAFAAGARLFGKEQNVILLLRVLMQPQSFPGELFDQPIDVLALRWMKGQGQ
jgi:hypothetical protein